MKDFRFIFHVFVYFKIKFRLKKTFVFFWFFGRIALLHLGWISHKPVVAFFFFPSFSGRVAWSILIETVFA